MYNKLPDKELILHNILFILPVAVLFVCNGFEKKIFMSSTPLRKWLLYFVFAFFISLLYYKFLTSLHEIGHYLIAVFFRKKNHLEVDIWMDKSHVSCSDWKVYKKCEAKIFLVSGVLFKIIYCIIMIWIFVKLNINIGIITFGYVIWEEVVLNVIPISKESDGYKLKHLDAFYNEIPEEKKRNRGIVYKENISFAFSSNNCSDNLFVL